MMQFKHPNLIKLRGAGRERELCWVASEWVAGESVTELINRIGVTGMLNWQRCWEITRDVARALEFAHEKNLVHRNILPSNIMVRDEDRQAKLGDLMLARALDAADSEKVTKAGEVVGNVSFMAPEQLTGDVPPDPRIDIYSLGATVYAMLTGRPPFESESSLELLRLVLNSNPDPPTKYNLSIPPLMVDLVMRMLAKNPRDRYESMTSVISDLERVAKFSGGVV
jgi:serine/threonine-protein kinase